MIILYVALFILVVSTMGGLFFVKRNPSLTEGPPKAVAFVLYFWIIALIQTGIGSLFYYFANK